MKPAEPSASTQLLLFGAAAPAAAAVAEWRHPQADREIELSGHCVAYLLRRVRRRSIGFTIGTEGLSVSAPKWVGLADIEAALRAKATWILRKLAEQQQRRQRLQAARVEWRDGAALPFLGAPLTVVLDPGARGSVFDADARQLRVGLPQQAMPVQLRDAVQSWLQRQARRLFEERCMHYAPLLGVRFTRLSLSSAQTRWGSASASGAIRLNWRLVHFGLATIDYVVVHELAHLREMNHSPRFWDVVRSVVPDYEQARLRLKEDVVPVLD